MATPSTGCRIGWPGAAPICRIERIRERGGQRSREIAYAIASLTPEQADPDALLTLWRDRWLIENRLRWRRDVILREDHRRIRSGAGPRAMAALRNAMPHLVQKAPGLSPKSERPSPKTATAPSGSRDKAFFEWPWPKTDATTR